MRILLTNDDGFNSEGLQILEKILCSYGHEVYVIAPSTQQSSTSHSITLRDSVTITNYSLNHYHLSGTPADCILYGARSGLFTHDDIDLVISGINQGANVSTDILYSGTLGAARQAVLLGFKAIAVSCSPKNMDYKTGIFAYEDAAHFLSKHLEEFKELCSINSLVNINVPPESDGKWVPCGVSFIDYNDNVVFDGGDLDYLRNNVGKAIDVRLALNPNNKPVVNKEFSEVLTDFEAIEQNIIAVTVIDALTSISPLHQDLKDLVGGKDE